MSVKPENLRLQRLNPKKLPANWPGVLLLCLKSPRLPNGKLNYGVGSGSKEEADRLGQIWVGEGARPTSDGTGLVSADGTRIYRSPKEKPNTPGSLNPTGTQANFESYTKNIETGKMDKIGNGHLNILGGK